MPWPAHAPPVGPNQPAPRLGRRLVPVVMAALIAALIAALAGCSSTPLRPTDPARPSPGTPPAGLPPGIDPGRDGPGANPPPDLLQVPDAEPRLEQIPPGGANKPYETLGRAYTPLTGDPPLLQRGLASWYGRKFHGRTTANGETYNMYAMTAAHKTMPLPSYARVRNPANGREVVVRVNDRGPFHNDRVIDLSYTAALKLGVLGGVAPVEIERITYEDIRAGNWRTPANLATLANLANQATLASFANLPSMAVAAPAAAAWPAAVPAPASIPVSAVPEAPPPLPAETRAVAQPAARAASGFWLQLGAFAQRDGAVGFQRRVAGEVAWLAPLLTIFNERQLHRLQAGPYASRSDARQAADRLREALNLIPAVVERR